jgi:murein DD-endopeptidase MepM/ murein hydrolase activator NlpD
MTGQRNNGYAHTGIDLNVDQYPWGDVDRGQPVFAIAPGRVYAIGYSQSYLGSVVIEIEHGGVLHWVRYWHLDEGFPQLHVHEHIMSGTYIGAIGNYQLGRGGDHLHLDMALDPFGPHWWFTNHRDVRWVDPVPVLRARLDSATIDAMLEKGA